MRGRPICRGVNGHRGGTDWIGGWPPGRKGWGSIEGWGGIEGGDGP